MRRLAMVLILVAALLFLIGLYISFTAGAVFGKVGVTFWRGAIAFLLFAIAALQLHAASKP